MLDSPTNTTSIFQIGWPGGVMTLRCAGVPPITEKGNDEIKSVMERFSFAHSRHRQAVLDGHDSWPVFSG